MNNPYQEAINILSTLIEDAETSKFFKEKAKVAIIILQNKKELALDKAIHELEELGSHEMPSYYRTQVWDVISLLESMK